MKRLFAGCEKYLRKSREFYILLVTFSDIILPFLVKTPAINIPNHHPIGIVQTLRTHAERLHDTHHQHHCKTGRRELE
jgi:hypothetical protein